MQSVLYINIYFPVTEVNTLNSNFIQCAIHTKFGVVGGMAEATWSWGYSFESMVLHQGVEVNRLRAERKRMLVFCCVC